MPQARLMSRVGVAAFAMLIAASFAGPASAQQKFVTIGTGGVTGVYYAVGGAICRLMNKDRAKTTASAARWNRPAARPSTSTPSRPASSISASRSPTCSIRRSKARSPSRTAAPTATCARSIRCIPSRSRSWRARKPSVAKFEDFKGKRFNVGNPGSGTRASMEQLLDDDGLEAVRLLARRRAEGRRARPGAMRQQDRRLLLRRRPSVARTSRIRPRPAAPSWSPLTGPGGRQAGQGESLLRQGDDPGRHVCRTIRTRPRPMACWRRW